MKILKILLALIVLGLVSWALIIWLGKEETPLMVEEPIIEIVPKQTIIGQSVEGRSIESFSFGSGSTQLLFIGGIHGGYEWNSVVLAYQFIDYWTERPEAVPTGFTVTIIPALNPDGLFTITHKEGRFAITDVMESEMVGRGRLNANEVDLNRNFDCQWQSESTWRNNPVSAGTSAFSEPEARALRDLVYETQPAGVVFWHSQADAVYASECENGILPETLEIMNAYADASGYAAVSSFDAYEITGDAEGWLASIGIPAVTVELSTHETIEWEENLAGVQALFNHYGK